MLAPALLRSRLVAPLLIASATLLAYSNSFDASFHLDDLGVFVQNERMHDLRNLWPPTGARWLCDLTFALNYRVGALEVAGYHAVNFAIHVLDALLVVALAAITLRTPAARDGRVSPLVCDHLPLTAGLLFALHPLATQSVTYIEQRFTSLATLLYVAAVVLYVHARLSLEDGRTARRVAGLAALSVLAAAAAMKTKEICVTLPFVVAGYELLFFRSWRRLWLAVPLAASAVIPFVDPTLGERLATQANLPRWPYLLTQARVVVTYLRLLVWPAGQNLDHDVRLSRSLAEPAVLLSIALLLAIGAFAAVLLVRARRTGSVEGMLVGGGIAWFFATLSVESSVLPIIDVMFEHRTYLPSVGAAIAFGTALLWGVPRLRLRAPPDRVAAVAVLLVVAPLGVATWRRNRVWKDDLTLWSDVVAKSPGKARPHQLLGEAHAQRGELDAAEREYLIALQLDPRYLDALYNLGNAYLAKRQLAEARVAFTQAVRYHPEHALSHNNLGAVLQRLGELEPAAAEYREALRLDPRLQLARDNLERLGQATVTGARR